MTDTSPVDDHFAMMRVPLRSIAAAI